MISEQPSTPRFLDAGEGALVVEFGTVIDPLINERVIRLDEALQRAAVPGILETVPTYRSLMIEYDPLVIDRDNLVAAVTALPPAAFESRREPGHWTIPCCYEAELGEDVQQIAALTDLSPARVVALHCSAAYRVYMYGFAPGFCYLGGLPPELGLSRRPSARPPTPPNVVLVAGGQSLISTVSMPTGWWLIGTTPERMFAPARHPVFLAEAGDLVRFEPIDRSTFAALELRAAAGEVVARRASG